MPLAQSLGLHQRQRGVLQSYGAGHESASQEASQLLQAHREILSKVAGIECVFRTCSETPDQAQTTEKQKHERLLYTVYVHLSHPQPPELISPCAHRFS